MSYCKRDGKDVSIFVTKDDVDNPEAVTSLAQDELYGIVLPSGELNWDCPCLGGMAYGPCGQEFKDAFSCFHYSEAEEKGSDCIPQFRTMQECFEKHPEEYGKYADNDDDGSDETQEREEEAGSRDKEAEQKGEEERTEKLGGGGGEGKGTAAKDQQQTKGENSKVEGERTTPAQASPEASTTK